ncbi:2-amino-4-hydroxy-6-hydroxymethyldihydropteridine diphosphokinase [Cecembia sp.]|uniref:2-amino-4-hydroxy-6- hydroxymethyldihydropteridine diphosphokinase n=1 Tax=Cecembia sp. TaxID=1898110 RepID=UPI0025BA3924|nr:2-amino-4-hydroxy-6-hydroxymethyldihydropteridine diphosphokinase [Cecembia sp.]
MENLVLIIGGNLGDRLLLIKKARNLLEKRLGKELIASSIFETEAWGGSSLGYYLNQVLVYQTALEPMQVLECIQEIENQLERKREVKWGNRTMDIDILYFGKRTINSEKLILPHPYLEKRKFVLEPLSQILPDFIHPSLGKSHQELLRICQDISEVKLYEKKARNIRAK